MKLNSRWIAGLVILLLSYVLTLFGLQSEHSLVTDFGGVLVACGFVIGAGPLLIPK